MTFAGVHFELRLNLGDGECELHGVADCRELLELGGVFSDGVGDESRVLGSADDDALLRDVERLGDACFGVVVVAHAEGGFRLPVGIEARLPRLLLRLFGLLLLRGVFVNVPLAVEPS